MSDGGQYKSFFDNLMRKQAREAGADRTMQFLDSFGQGPSVGQDVLSLDAFSMLPLDSQVQAIRNLQGAGENVAPYLSRAGMEGMGAGDALARVGNVLPDALSAVANLTNLERARSEGFGANVAGARDVLTEGYVNPDRVGFVDYAREIGAPFPETTGNLLDLIAPGPGELRGAVQNVAQGVATAAGEFLARRGGEVLGMAAPFTAAVRRASRGLARGLQELVGSGRGSSNAFNDIYDAVSGNAVDSWGPGANKTFELDNGYEVTFDPSSPFRGIGGGGRMIIRGPELPSAAGQYDTRGQITTTLQYVDANDEYGRALGMRPGEPPRPIIYVDTLVSPEGSQTGAIVGGIATDLADSLGLPMFTYPSQFAHRTTPTPELMDLYNRNGFVPLDPDNPSYFVREPLPTDSAARAAETEARRFSAFGRVPELDTMPMAARRAYWNLVGESDAWRHYDLDNPPNPLRQMREDFQELAQAGLTPDEIAEGLAMESTSGGYGGTAFQDGDFAALVNKVLSDEYDYLDTLPSQGINFNAVSQTATGNMVTLNPRQGPTVAAAGQTASTPSAATTTSRSYQNPLPIIGDENATQQERARAAVDDLNRLFQESATEFDDEVDDLSLSEIQMAGNWSISEIANRAVRTINPNLLTPNSNEIADIQSSFIEDLEMAMENNPQRFAQIMEIRSPVQMRQFLSENNVPEEAVNAMVALVNSMTNDEADRFAKYFARFDPAMYN